MVQVPSPPVLISSKRSSGHLEKYPAKKHFCPSSPRFRAVHVGHFDELRSLLLEKAGHDSKSMNEETKKDALKAEYSPRIVDLLDSISESLYGPAEAQYDDEKLSVGSEPLSDFTQNSEDDGFAVVPSPTQEKLISLEVPSILTVPEQKAEKIVKQEAKAPLQDQQVPELTAYKSETEIAMSRIFDLGKVSGVKDPSIAPDAPYNGPSVITMSGFGELGRYGNQILQYIFLKSYAVRHNISEIQVPGWVGAGLFGLRDRPVQRALPATVEFRGTVANSTFTTDFIDFVKTKSSNDVPELFPDVLSPADTNGPVPTNVDMWGWFQWHTSHFAPFKNALLDTFTPVPELYDTLHSTFDRELRFRGGQKRTVVGLHLRLGDYKSIAASSFGYCAPTSWYLSWLERIWPTLENPVLFVASDDVEAVLRDFSAYDPITADSIGMKVPDSMSGLKAGFFPDWFSLTQCDVLAISNSTFSFTACMMNQRPNAQFFRAHFRGTMEQIDPWNADPIVHRDMNKAGLSAALETLQIVYNTQGSGALAKNILYELPYYGIRSAITKAVLWRQAKQQEPIPA